MRKEGPTVGAGFTIPSIWFISFLNWQYNAAYITSKGGDAIRATRGGPKSIGDVVPRGWGTSVSRWTCRYSSSRYLHLNYAIITLFYYLSIHYNAYIPFRGA